MMKFFLVFPVSVSSFLDMHFVDSKFSSKTRSA